MEFKKYQAKDIISKEKLIDLRKSYSIKEIALQTGYSTTTLNMILKGEKIENKKSSSMCEKFKNEIILDIQNNIKQIEIARKYNINPDTLSRYIKKHNLRENISLKESNEI